MSRTANTIRREFLDFFAQHGHAIVPGSPVIPYDDPTLLFTNAGMNQFKDVFLGSGTRPYRRAANTQPCIRAGGKHNDLDDVGHDSYHHTFFEMLGNWSFGDYFKKEAISWAWELLTKVWGLDRQRLHATYFGGDPAHGLESDEQARWLWSGYTDIDPAHIHPGSMKDNFWEMGETGPCGPCSELHIDLTPDKSGAALVNKGDARVIEIWNLVFIQFNRGRDGQLTPLPARHVDTGMGFERVTAVLQGHHNNYATESFLPIIQAIEHLAGHRYGAHVAAPPAGNRYAAFSATDMADVACRVIADHVRTLSFAIADGCLPDKDGRGYVLRRILRRAVRYGWQHLKLHEPFLCKLVPVVVDAMGEAFPKLKQDPARIVGALREEEESFERTLGRGIELFEEAAGRARHEHHGEIRGADAFKLHDTFGFPIDLTEIMAGERGMRVDIGEYERLMDEARTRARGERGLEADRFAGLRERLTLAPTDDHPKYSDVPCEATIRAVATPPGTAATPGIVVAFIPDRTCLYVEQGGQVGDVGQALGEQLRVDVERVERAGESIVHYGTVVQGELRPGQRVRLVVDSTRGHIMMNHTATHVLNWALRETLGEHVDQKGSLVDAEKTRFDFSHPKPLSSTELAAIERLCQQQIARKLPVYAREVPQAEARRINGLRAVFGEKYPDVVRVVSIGAPVEELLAAPGDPRWRQFSIEFCGGTHVASTESIQEFVIVSEEAVAKGVRRVVGITGVAASLATAVGAELVRQARELLEASSEVVQAALPDLQGQLTGHAMRAADRAAVRELIAQLQSRLKQQHKQDARAAAAAARDRVGELLERAETRGSTTLVVGEAEGLGLDELKTAADMIKQKAGSAALLLASRGEGRVILLAAMSDDVVQRGIRAGDLVKQVAPLVGGGGGGPPTMAQAGGKNPEQLPAALEAGRQWLRARLS